MPSGMLTLQAKNWIMMTREMSAEYEALWEFGKVENIVKSIDRYHYIDKIKRD
jgi:hypothetical protein